MLMATTMSAYAQNNLEKVNIEVTQIVDGHTAQTYHLEGTIGQTIPFSAKKSQFMPIESHPKAVSAFHFSMAHAITKNEYVVTVKDFSTSGYSNFQEDDSFMSQKINFKNHKSQEVVVSDTLKFKITLL